MADEESPVMKQRRMIHKAITEAFDDSVIGGWVLVYERIAPMEDREGEAGFALEITSGDATGETSLRPWTEQGWLFAAAHDPDNFNYYQENEDDG
jgi:hypothetical protein